MYNWILAIDGGGTKTLGVLYNLKGEEIKRVTVGFSNFSIDQKQAKTHIFEVIDQLLKHVDKPQEVHIEMGISGASTIEDKEGFLQEISSKFHVTCALENDATTALYAVSHQKNENVMLVIGGTGSVIMTKIDEQVEIYGGYGHLLGDEGSSYHLSIQAIKKLITDLEKNEFISCLSSKLKDEIQVNNRQEIISYIYGRNKTDIAKLSSIVSEAAHEGCKDAIELLKQEGTLIAQQIVHASKKMKKNHKVIIALRGGLLLNAPYVKDALIESINYSIQNYEIDMDPVEPVYGAFKLGLQEISKR